MKQGVIYYQKGQFSKALRIFLKCYESNNIDLNGEAFGYLTKCYEQLQDWQGLSVWLERLEVENLSLCITKIARKFPDLSKQKTWKSKFKRQKEQIEFQLINFCILTDRVDLAYSILRNKYASDSKSRSTLVYLCKLLQKQGKTQELETFLSRLLELFPSQRDHYIRQARNFSLIGKFHKALNILRKGIQMQLDKSKVLLYVEKGRIHAMVDEFEQALGAFGIAIQIDRNEEKIYLQLAKLLSSHHIRKQNLQNTFLCFCYISDPKNIICEMFLKIHLACSLRKVTFTIVYPSQILRLGPEWSYQIALLHISTWELQNLRVYFKNNPIFGSHFNERKLRTIRNLALCNEALQEYNQAFKCYSVLYEEDKSWHNFQWQVSCALNLARLGYKQQVLKRLKRIEGNTQTMYKAGIEAQDRFAELYFLLGMYQKSIQFYLENKDGQHFKIHLWGLNSYSALKQYQKAGLSFTQFCRRVRQFNSVQFISYQFIELMRLGAKYGFFSLVLKMLEKMTKIIAQQKDTYGARSHLNRMEVVFNNTLVEIQLKSKQKL